MLRTVGPLLAAAAAVFPAGCARRAPAPRTAADEVLRVSQRNEPADLDPALAALPDDFFVIRALSEGLVTGEDGTYWPAAAESWRVSADGFTWTFHLRADERWSDGEPVTAGDFVASFRRVLSPSTAAPKAELFFPVKNARAYYMGRLTHFSTVGFLAPDPRTLIVTLERPNPWFLAYAASGPWIPVNPRVVARLGRGWTRPGNFVGNGPFVLAAWLPSQQIVVRKNPFYHAAASVRLDEIQFIRFDDTDTEDRAYRAGQVDVTMTVPIDKLAPYERDRPAELHHGPLAEARYLAFNTRRPPLDDPRVRRALSLALDRPRLVRDVLRGGQAPADRLMPPELQPPGDMAGRLGPPGPAQPAAEAARLLAEAGFPGGHGFPVLELTGWSPNPILEAIQDMWRKRLGIDVTVTVREARAHEAALRSGRYDIGFITLIPDVADPVAVLERFTSASPENYPHWSDPAYDRLVAAAAAETHPGRQADLLRAAETRLMDQLPLAPIYFNSRNWLMRPGLRGWEEDALWTRNYLDLYWEQPPPP